MKTNVVLQSADRELFGITIKQQTKNSFISVSDLALAYERGRWQYGWSSTGINQIMQSHTLQERIYYLLKERDLIKVGFPTFTEMVEREGIVKVLKGLQVWATTGRGANKSVYADPYIWVLLAMELNPLMYAKVIMWVTDSLIFDRLEAGSEYMPMNAQVKKICPDNKDVFMNVAIAINKKIFGHHQTGMRNLASSAQLKQVADLEKFIAQSISAGFIKSQPDILAAIDSYLIKGADVINTLSLEYNKAFPKNQ